ncbi:acyl-CoA dehydrogenase family protein [[Mycobacterium] vasticus]|uniref:Acyl-CoA dehydrogenase family protein n=1 Tax=[Mycobacterium] vasticus TaxID=2875777 RepID=A0ABU5YZI7_9MYCO|nr:acyl-CoA dehydrogenase family protein [Mycolicibacter sp. MYC017]MEB3070261.1 acyl-CoA dehydrogenase family protein [Mycolicibacter sp. MYC017]
MIKDFTDEQRELRNTVRRYLDEHSTEADVRAHMDTERGYDPQVWSTLAAQLGVHGLAIPEQYGGQGFSWIELGIVIEEMGRALLCAPFFSSIVLAATVILECGDHEAKRRLLPGIADGSTIATVALPGEGTAVEAARKGDTWSLTGNAALVLDGHVADLILIPATTSDGLRLFTVDGSAAGCTATAVPTLDQTRKLADLTLEAVQATPLGDGPAEPVLARAGDFAVVALALEQVGGAHAALDISVDYLKTRVQFGQPIGSFQALKHMAADVFVEVETARSAAYYALFALAEGNEEIPAAAALAAAYCSDAFVSTAHQMIQFHGGMGFTWELPAHLYFKRARSSQLLLGDPDQHRERLAQLIGL